MKKILRCFNLLVYPLILCLVILQLPRYGLAQEEIVIDNYYPSPAGYYDQLKVNTSLNFKYGASISTTGTAGEVAMITFNADGMVFGPQEGARFDGEVTVVGDMTNERNCYFSIRRTLHGDNNITANRVTAQQIVGQRITSINESLRGAYVRDTTRGWDLGASVETRLDEDVDIQGLARVNGLQATAITATAVAMSLFAATGLSEATMIAIGAAIAALIASDVSHIYHALNINPNL